MKVLVLDNYDSFTFNLVQLIKANSALDVFVYRNDEIELDDVVEFDKIVLSPGPGLPSDAGIMSRLIKKYYTTKSIFGVCLGMQAIGEVFGASLINLDTPKHGVSTLIYHNNADMFKNIPQQFLVGRYHSWVIDSKQLSKEIIITAHDQSGHVMALQHAVYDLSGVQFHPESVLTEYGNEIIQNFLQHSH